MAVDNTKLVFNALTGNFDLVQDVSALATTADLSAYIPLTQKAAALGVATLDASGKLLSSQVSAIAITDTYVVASQAAMLALSAAETGDIAVRTDLNKTFILKGTTYSVLADWQELLTPTDAVQSVNGQTGTVVLSTTNIAEGTNLYYTNARVASLVTPTVDYVNRQLLQSGFVAANWSSVGFDMYDAVNTSSRNIANTNNISFSTGAALSNFLIASNRTSTIAAAGTATITLSSSRYWQLMYRANRSSGGNDCKVGTLMIAKENAGNNTNASINDTGVATNASMNSVNFTIDASGNLLVTNNTAFSIDIRVGTFQL